MADAAAVPFPTACHILFCRPLWWQRACHYLQCQWQRIKSEACPSQSVRLTLFKFKLVLCMAANNWLFATMPAPIYIRLKKRIFGWKTSPQYSKSSLTWSLRDRKKCLNYPKFELLSDHKRTDKNRLLLSKFFGKLYNRRLFWGEHSMTVAIFHFYQCFSACTMPGVYQLQNDRATLCMRRLHWPRYTNSRQHVTNVQFWHAHWNGRITWMEVSEMRSGAIRRSK